MTHTRRPWSEEDIAELKSMAGTHPVIVIAAQLRRSPAAVAVEASKLGLSLRTRPRHFGRSVQNGVEVSRTERQSKYGRGSKIFSYTAFEAAQYRSAHVRQTADPIVFPYRNDQQDARLLDKRKDFAHVLYI